MAWYNTLNIPSGLEELFAKVLQLKPNLGVTGIGLTLPQQTVVKKKVTGSRSPFVRWQSLWQALNGTYKINWRFYWKILEHNNRPNVGGWPGSGFSGYVFINAPRYKASLAFLDDAPLPLAQYFIEPSDLASSGVFGTSFGLKQAIAYTPSANQTINKVAIAFFGQNGTPVGDIIVNIYSGGGAPEAGTLLRGPIAVNVNNVSSQDLTLPYLFFTLSSALNLVAGTTYYIVVKPSSTFTIGNAPFTRHLGFTPTPPQYNEIVGWNNTGSWSAGGAAQCMGFCLF
jgi:hypothetical protein